MMRKAANELRNLSAGIAGAAQEKVLMVAGYRL